MGDRLDIGRAFKGAITCPLPIFDRLFGRACFSVVVSQQFGFCLCPLREPSFQDLCDATMQSLAFALEQALVSRILNERMLEGVARIRWRAALKQQLGIDESMEGFVESFRITIPDCLKQIM